MAKKEMKKKNVVEDTVEADKVAEDSGESWTEKEESDEDDEW